MQNLKQNWFSTVATRTLDFGVGCHGFVVEQVKTKNILHENA
jgi:hypothetical protein